METPWQPDHRDRPWTPSKDDEDDHAEGYLASGQTAHGWWPGKDQQYEARDDNPLAASPSPFAPVEQAPLMRLTTAYLRFVRAWVEGGRRRMPRGWLGQMEQVMGLSVSARSVSLYNQRDDLLELLRRLQLLEALDDHLYHRFRAFREDRRLIRRPLRRFRGMIDQALRRAAESFPPP